MKNIICLLAITTILASGTIGYCSSFCPSMDVFTQETGKIQKKSLDMYKKSQQPNSKVGYDAVGILQESSNYIKNTTNGCINYFKTASQPDCSKALTLSTSYISLSLINKPEADKLAPQIESITNACPMEFASLKMVQQQFNNRELKF